MMNITINKYIETCLINEYADKDFHSGYSLDIHNIPEYELSNFLSFLIKKDNTIRDLILERMQELINDRLYRIEYLDRRNSGYMPTHNKQTGEVKWVPQSFGRSPL